MRAALLSDIHGNRVALEAVLDDIADAGVDRTVCLGDIVDLGPEPSAVLGLLRELGISCVRGNHDPLDEVPQVPELVDIQRWTAEQLTVEERRFLTDLPDQLRVDLDGCDLLCVHGSPRSRDDNLVAETPEVEVAEMLGDLAFDLLACGHTHVQMVRRRGARTLVNVGSAGMPFEGVFAGGPPRILPWAEYAIAEHRGGRLRVELRRVPVAFDGLRAAVSSSGMPHAEMWLSMWRI
jgi:putative phosphoesterase